MKKRVSKKDLREFGLIIGIIFPLFLGWVIPSLFNHSFRLWTLIISFPTISLALIAPMKLSFFYDKWMALGNFLAFVNSYIIFGIIFFLIMLPMSIIMKLGNYDPLKLRKSFLLTYKEYKKYNFDIENLF